MSQLDVVSVLSALFQFPFSADTCKVWLNSFTVAPNNASIQTYSLSVVDCGNDVTARLHAWGNSNIPVLSSTTTTFELDKETFITVCELLHLPSAGNYNISMSKQPSGRLQMHLQEKKTKSLFEGVGDSITLESSKFEVDSTGNYFIKGEEYLAQLGDEGQISFPIEPFWSLSRLIITVMSAELVADVIPYCIEEGAIEFRWKSPLRLYLQVWYNPEYDEPSFTLTDSAYYESLFFTFTYLPEDGAILNKDFPFSNHSEIENVLSYLKLSKNTAELVEKLFH